MGKKRRTPATGSEARSDRVFMAVEADSTDEELEAMAEAIVQRIEERDPDFFLPEGDARRLTRRVGLSSMLDQISSIVRCRARVQATYSFR
jgi:hypothetical protein